MSRSPRRARAPRRTRRASSRARRPRSASRRTDRRVVGAAGRQDAAQRRRRRRRGAAGAAARIARRRTCASGSRAAAPQHLVVDGRGADQRFERQAAHAARRSTPRRPPGVASRREHARARRRPARASLRCDPDERFEALGDAETIGHRVAARAASSSSVRSAASTCAAVTYGRRPIVSQIAARTSASASTFSRAASGGDDGVERATPAADGGSLLPALRGLGDGVGGLGADLRQRVSAARAVMSGMSAGRSRRPSARMAIAHGLRVAAVRAGSDDGEIARRRRAAILGLQHGQARRARRSPAASCARATADARAASESTKARRRPAGLRGLRDLAVDFTSHARRCRVAAEYSSICVVRSSGYEIVDVGDRARRVRAPPRASASRTRCRTAGCS